METYFRRSRNDELSLRQKPFWTQMLPLKRTIGMAYLSKFDEGLRSSGWGTGL